MVGGIVVIGAGIGMILIDAWFYGVFLICVGIAVFGFGNLDDMESKPTLAMITVVSIRVVRRRRFHGIPA